METELRICSRGCAVLAVVAFATAAHADARLSAVAKEHMDRGLAEYQARNYEAAVIEFQAAYAIEPRREILFAWGQAERLRGDCAKALTLYRQFLALSPPPEEARRADERITECERVQSQREAVPVTQPAAPPAVQSTAEPVVRPPASESPWYRDGLGATLVGVGTLGAATGVTLLVLSQRAITAMPYGPFDDAATRADHQYIGGLVGTIAGALVLGVGIVRLVTAEPARASSVSLIVGSTGVAVAGRF